MKQCKCGSWTILDKCEMCYWREKVSELKNSTKSNKKLIFNGQCIHGVPLGQYCKQCKYMKAQHDGQ